MLLAWELCRESVKMFVHYPKSIFILVPSCVFAGSAAAGSSAGISTLEISSSSSANNAIGVLTGAFSPSWSYSHCKQHIENTANFLHLILTRIRARTPSSWASTSIWALSVSSSKSTSPAEKLSPVYISPTKLLFSYPRRFQTVHSNTHLP